MMDREHSVSRDQWITRYGVALAATVLAAAFGVASFLAEDGSAPAGGAIVMGVYALLALYGGQTHRFRLLRDDLDERERLLVYRALAVSSGVVGSILLALYVRDLINSEAGGLPMWLLLTFGLVYGSAFVYFRWRG